MTCFCKVYYKNLSWMSGMDRKIVRGSLYGITRLCRVMPNSVAGGQIFLSAPDNHEASFSYMPFDLQRLILTYESP